MRHAWRALGAQVAAETLSRLRSAGTIFTVLMLVAAAFAYVPPPDSNQVSIMWHSGEQHYSGIYTAGFIGAVVAMLTAMLLPLVGFYLVTGSVRRDLERRVWPILAATPTSPAIYLLGKWLAAVAYLLVLASLALVPGIFLFVRFGTGPLDLAELLLPWLLIVPTAMTLTASFALLFDVTPGLRGRGGYVIWFFAFSFFFFMLPAIFGRMLDQDRGNDRATSYDPSGLVLIDRLITASTATPVEGVSLGINYTDEPVERVPFARLHVDAPLVARRVAMLAWALVPLALALLIFPLSTGRRQQTAPHRPRGRLQPVGDEAALAAASLPPVQAPAVFHAHAGTPTFARSVLADGLLIWNAASWARWPLLLASGVTLFLPAVATKVTIAIFLLLLGLVIAEAAAREKLAGTAATVFAQPGVPRSAVLWKVAAVTAFVMVIGAPVLVRSIVRGPAHGLAMLLALLFVATAAAGLGWLSGGGKLFLGLFTALWYVAIQGDSPLDFSGAIASRPDLALCAGFAAAGVVLALTAWLFERARAARGDAIG